MNAPLLRIPERSDLISLLPGAVRTHGHLIVPHGPAEVKILKALGIGVPSSLVHYDWCGWEPFKIQRITVEMLVSNPRGYVLSSMGTGKTKCVLWAYDHLRRMGAVKRMLVVAPLNAQLHVGQGNTRDRTTLNLVAAWHCRGGNCVVTTTSTLSTMLA